MRFKMFKNSLAEDFCWASGILLFFVLFAPVSMTVAAEPLKPRLMIAAYDSLMTKEGWGTWVVEEFRKQCQCEVKVVTVGDAGALVTRFEIEQKRQSPEIDLYMGLDQNLFTRIEKDCAPIDSKLQYAVRRERFLAFDWGEYRLLARDDSMKKAGLIDPVSLFDLAKESYRKRFVLEDPRTSTPGLAFIAFADAILRDQGKTSAEVAAYWRAMRSQWVTLAPSWDSAYALFLKGESAMVWTYSTSLAYHRSRREGGYHLVKLKEGAPVQVEGAVVSSRRFDLNRELISRFLGLMVSKEAQSQVAEKNWMFPIRDDVALPASFQGIARPDHHQLDFQSKTTIDEVLNRWRKAVF